jgi:peptidoglycan/LPS O-acetylase OafA/YrhL
MMVQASGPANVFGSHSAYRADLDGLRALSIIAVIGFHAEFPGFAAGFIGVDVFFVISGFLITRLLLNSTRRSLRQQLQEFYTRRARRILPALFVVLFATAATGFLLVFPDDLRRMGRTLFFATTMLGNVGSWLGGGYFDDRTTSGFLEHLWSIGVEEQFYLFYPLAFFLLGRGIFHRQKVLVIGTAFISLLLCFLAGSKTPAANYYLLPTRGWELLFGAAAALSSGPRLMSRATAEVSAVSALIAFAIGTSVNGVSESYPNGFALLPTTVALLLITSGESHATFVTRALSARVLVFVGLISYSLYLWHVPVFGFFTYYNIRPPSLLQKIVLVAVLVAISIASWRWIETPIRSKSVLKSSQQFWIVAALAFATLIAVAVMFWSLAGFSGRMSKEQQPEKGAAMDFSRAGLRCMSLSSQQIESGALCRFGSSKDTSAVVILWGDSHALALLPAYEALAESHDVTLYFAGNSACRPLTGVRQAARNGRTDEECARFNISMLRAIDQLQPSGVILNAFWVYPDLEFVAEDGSRRNSRDGFREGLEQTLSRIAQPTRTICLVLDPPTLPYPLPYALAMTSRRRINNDFLAATHDEAMQQSSVVESVFQEMTGANLAVLVDPKDALCGPELCRILSQDGLPLYRDRNHLSAIGARYVERTLLPCFELLQRGND